MNKVSAATFIRNTFEGAFCVFESMASFMPLVDDMTIIDLGSTDGTLQVLQEIAAANPRVRVVRSRFSKVDAGAFADVANDCVASWQHNQGIFWQADEICHHNLLRLLRERLDNGDFDLVLWRYQLQENFQKMRWPPHPVHRIGTKGKFQFVDDGMNTNRSFEPPIVGNYNMGWFIRWGAEFEDDYTQLPTHEMVLDISAAGGFLRNIVRKRKLHAPMWHEQPNMDGVPIMEWYAKERVNPNWTMTRTPFDIPQIMRWHLGRKTYILRPELKEALKTGKTEEMVGL